MPKIDRVVLELPSHRTVNADQAKPTHAPAGGVILIHEWWGLNDEMRARAAHFSEQGFLALAIDLFQGESTNDPARARELMNGIDPVSANETVVAWARWLRSQSYCNGRVGAVGYCLGGGWALNTSIATPIDATVIYYGNVRKAANELASLKGPVLGHFGKQDQSIPLDVVEAFGVGLRHAGKSVEIHLYDAGHAFSRIGGPNFDAASASMAEQRTLDFLHAHLD
jgi:carboxymethylenebutenolidase